jgi:hypothetical protein
VAFFGYLYYAAQRAEAVPVSQYSVTSVRRRSRSMASSGSSAAGSLHSLNYIGPPAPGYRTARLECSSCPP